MHGQPALLKRRKQRGQTLVLVALCLVVLISMAALAIDLTTLYVARGEMQRAADAAALAGAQAFVSSGLTTDPSNGTLRGLATMLANSYVTGVNAKNTVGGVVPTSSTAFDFTNPGNPQITVTMQRTDVPTFFARIFGQHLATVSATAIAEAYNSSYTGASNSMPPVAPTCTKPWLVANLDPDHGGATPQPFVNADGSLANPGVSTGAGGGIIAEPITLPDIWQTPLASPLTKPGYLPANLPNAPGGTCPSCSGGGGNFAESVACCDTANAAQYSCGANPSTLTVDTNSDRAGSLAGAECLLTGAGGSGPTPQASAKDILDANPFWMSGGAAAMEIQSGTAPHSGEVVTTSGQIVTLPIISTNVAGPTVNVVGFMQAFVQSTSDAGLQPGAITMYVLNISGCGTNINTGATPVSGGGVSAVPVRLIHP
jgi:Flp pilus assembly protein TadG